jgi:hypothetical protein
LAFNTCRRQAIPPAAMTVHAFTQVAIRSRHQMLIPHIIRRLPRISCLRAVKYYSNILTQVISQSFCNIWQCAGIKKYPDGVGAVVFRLFGLGSVHGAYASASAALYAGIGIDYVAVLTLRYSGYRALILASAALDASVSDLIGHGKHLLIIIMCDAVYHKTCIYILSPVAHKSNWFAVILPGNSYH